MTATQDDMIAELQNANAALQARLDAALTQRNSDYDERIQHQAATIDVLKAMSASPGDPQPVFDLIVRQARALLDVPAVASVRIRRSSGSFACQRRRRDDFGAAAWEAYKSGWPRTPDRGSLTCRAILDGGIIHVCDMTTEPGISQMVRNSGARTNGLDPVFAGRTSDWRDLARAARGWTGSPIARSNC